VVDELKQTIPKAFHFPSFYAAFPMFLFFLNLQTHVKSQILVTSLLFYFSRKALGDGE